MKEVSGNITHISVVVIAHDRKKYLIEALKSLLVQTLDRNFYEIIVVKNFSDTEIDQYIRAIGGANIITNCVNPGQKLSIGIQASRGNIICILADDDLYEKTKLKVVFELFKSSNELIYYHNGFQTIDENGISSNIRYYKNPTKRILYSSNQLKYDVISKIIKFRGYHNDSSIAIRKSFYLKYLETLEQFRVSWDFLFFVIALSSNLDLIIDDKVLTFFRVHNSLSHFSGNYLDFLRWRNKLAYFYIEELTLIKSIIDNNKIREFVDYNLIAWKVILALTLERNKRFTSWRDSLYILKNFKIELPQGKYLALIGSLVSFFSPSIASRLYFIYNKLSNRY